MSAELPAPTSIAELAVRVDGQVVAGDRSLMLRSLASLESAGMGELSFVTSAKHRQAAAGTRASALLVTPALIELVPAGCAAIQVKDPYASYALIAQWIDASRRERDLPPAGVHPDAIVDPGAILGAGVRIGPGCVVEAHARLGDRVTLSAGVVVGRRSRIGADSRLSAQVVIYQDCQIGQRAIIHSGAVIGSDGFGFAPDTGQWSKIPQLGRVVIGDDVEIGANTTIDRGALDDTVIGNGTKLDNLIQIGHNVRIGEHCVLAGCVGVAGSAVIGNRVQIGGGCGIVGHLQICDDVIISGWSMVDSSIREPGRYTGAFPLLTHAGWRETAATLRQLPRLRDRLRALEQLSGKRQ